MPRLANPPAEGYQSANYALDSMRVYVVECLRRLGKDPYLCELCGERQTKECQIHHKKYAGSTIYDLAYACQSCQVRAENVGLQ